MANAKFTSFSEAMIGAGPHGAIDFDADDIKLVGIDHADDTPVIATDQDLADLLAGSRVVTTASLAGKTSTGGTFDSNDALVTAGTGDQFESLVMYKDTGTPTTSPLTVYYDVATGLPFTPSGGNITIAPHASGWFTV
jgi:hypothetical protein